MAKATGFLISPWHYTCLPTLPWENLTHDSLKPCKQPAFESGQTDVWGWGFPAWNSGSLKYLGKDLVEISWLSDELNQRKCGRQTMPSPQGQSVGLSRDCRAMPLSSGSSDTFGSTYFRSKKNYNPEVCAFRFLPKLLL